MRISDWSSDVCSSDLAGANVFHLEEGDVEQDERPMQQVERDGGTGERSDRTGNGARDLAMALADHARRNEVGGNTETQVVVRPEPLARHQLAAQLGTAKGAGHPFPQAPITPCR